MDFSDVSHLHASEIMFLIWVISFNIWTILLGLYFIIELAVFVWCALMPC